MRLADKITVVTGGASGIGASVCDTFAREGACVVLIDRDGPAAEAKAATLDNTRALQVDVAEPNEVDAAIGSVVEQYGRLDVLANIAGVDDLDTKARLAKHFSEGASLDITSHLTNEQWRRMISINLDGVFYCMRAALRVMVPQASGSIVNMSSLAGIVGSTGMAHYAASKAGVLGLTRSVAKEVADRGIRVNAIAPGKVNTPMNARSPAGLGGPIPMNRGAVPDEIAAAVLFLASDESSYITGETLNVNGASVTL